MLLPVFEIWARKTTVCLDIYDRLIPVQFLADFAISRRWWQFGRCKKELLLEYSSALSLIQYSLFYTHPLPYFTILIAQSWKRFNQWKYVDDLSNINTVRKNVFWQYMYTCAFGLWFFFYSFYGQRFWRSEWSDHHHKAPLFLRNSCETSHSLTLQTTADGGGGGGGGGRFGMPFDLSALVCLVNNLRPAPIPS